MAAQVSGSGMTGLFEIAADDVMRLGDHDLRALVAMLCEAELALNDLPTSAVRWGGAQTAPDGGLDVRVELPPASRISGFVPSPLTGIQVKRPGMAPSAILAEMRPSGALRPVIADLARAGGAYLIASSGDTLSDAMLQRRRRAMREACGAEPACDGLHVDFYDAAHLARWACRHPGVAAWIRSRLGRELDGWRPHGAWSRSDGDPGYLRDGGSRLRFGQAAVPLSVNEGLERIRTILALPGRSVRLLGLSGVGKTRLAEALFDAQVGGGALAPAEAVYADLGTDIGPSAATLMRDLAMRRLRAIVVVDNCPAALHRDLAAICLEPGALLSLLTIEYDVGDDQPEGTDVVVLDVASDDVVARLVGRRFPSISSTDRGTIAAASGGNARLALALAATVGPGEGIGVLRDRDLLARLFLQRHAPDPALLATARVCALAYSFDVGTGEDGRSELAILLAMADVAIAPARRHLAEMARRGLLQSRGPFRAVLPLAVANWLASDALREHPVEVLEETLIRRSARLAKSFSKRLGSMHGDANALVVVRRWLAPGGLLADAGGSDPLRVEMFADVAALDETASLSTLESLSDLLGRDAALDAWTAHLQVVRALAYEASLFARAVAILAEVALRAGGRGAEDAYAQHASLFTLFLSGTQASIASRLAIVEARMSSDDPAERRLGSEALERALRTGMFSSIGPFDFGARSRDEGWSPEGDDDVTTWFDAVFDLVARLADDPALGDEVGEVFARHVAVLVENGFWEGVERVCGILAAHGFWRRGWSACTALRRCHHGLSAQDEARLGGLIRTLAPRGLREEVEAFVFGPGPDDDDPMEEGEAGSDRAARRAVALGSRVALAPDVLGEVLADVGRHAGRSVEFGAGLMRGTADRARLWEEMAAAFRASAAPGRRIDMLVGALREIAEADRGHAEAILDAALVDPGLRTVFPLLQAAAGMGAGASARLLRTAGSSDVPVEAFAAVARACAAVPAPDLRMLLERLCGRVGGFDAALRILAFRSRTGIDATSADELAAAAGDLAGRLPPDGGNHCRDHDLAGIVRRLSGEGTAAVLARSLRRNFVDGGDRPQVYDDVLRSLFATHPRAALDAFVAPEREDGDGTRRLMAGWDLRRNPVDAVTADALAAWCAEDPERRFPAAAAFVTVRPDRRDRRGCGWTPHAIALLRRAPDPLAVLRLFVLRFRPSNFRHARTADLEAFASLLDRLPGGCAPDAADVEALRRDLRIEAEEERRRWASIDRSFQRFE